MLMICVAGLVPVCAWCVCDCVVWACLFGFEFLCCGLGVVLKTCGCLFVLSLLCVVVLLFHTACGLCA